MKVTKVSAITSLWAGQEETKQLFRLQWEKSMDLSNEYPK